MWWEREKRHEHQTMKSKHPLNENVQVIAFENCVVPTKCKRKPQELQDLTLSEGVATFSIVMDQETFATKFSTICSALLLESAHISVQSPAKDVDCQVVFHRSGNKLPLHTTFMLASL